MLNTFTFLACLFIASLVLTGPSGNGNDRAVVLLAVPSILGVLSGALIGYRLSAGNCAWHAVSCVSIVRERASDDGSSSGCELIPGPRASLHALPADLDVRRSPAGLVRIQPSDAAEQQDDPTIRREITLAEWLNCSVLIKVNTFAAASPYPDDLATMADPVGKHTDAAIQAAVAFCREHNGILLACWGTPKGKAATRRLAAHRFREVAALTSDWTALRVTKDSHPEHPLYLPGGLLPQPWRMPA